MTAIEQAAKLVAQRKEQDRLSGIAFERDYEARIIIDLDGTILVANLRARLITAHPDLVGQNFRILLPKRFSSVHENYVQRFIGDPRSRPMGFGRDLYMLDGRGVEKRVELSLNPLEDSEGSMKICVGIVVPPARDVAVAPEVESTHAPG